MTRKEARDLDRLIQLWMCRILRPAPVLREFVGDEEYSDDDIARRLGLVRSGRSAVRSSGLSSSGNEVRIARRRRIEHFDQRCCELEELGLREELPEAVAPAIEEVGRVFGLTRLDRSIYGFLLAAERDSELAEALKLAKAREPMAYIRAIGRALKRPVQRVEARLRSSAPLWRMGIVDQSFKGLFYGMPVVLSAEVRHDAPFDPELIFRSVCAKLPAPSLCLEDFRHLAETLDSLITFLRRAHRQRLRGVNVLLYGPPGTGKTELAGVLAAKLGLPGLSLSAVNGDGDPIPGKNRLQNLRPASVVVGRRRGLLVVDEAEDLFRGESLFDRGAADRSKAWFNEHLGSNPAPTIWISNSVRCLDDAFIRRFDFVLEMGIPPLSQRLRICRNVAGEILQPETIEQIAQVEEIPPAMVARAARVAEAAGGKGGPVDQRAIDLMRSTLRAQGKDESRLGGKASPVTRGFSLRQLNSDPPLESFATALQPGTPCRILLHGPPGTGKTTFGHWLARKVGQPFHLKTASDVLSPFLGITEQKIAHIFRDAEKERAVLMIDEVDSILFDRSGANRSWEVTQVNELLSRMERYGGILVMATNRLDAIDPAAVRRFDFKVRLDYLKPDQVLAILRAECRDLGIPRPGKRALATARGLESVVPGDFAVARRRHRFAAYSSAEELLKVVEGEAARRSVGTRRMGFEPLAGASES